jgi:hypothetical protein
VSLSVGCALRFLFFFEALEIFLKQFFLSVGFASSIKNFGRVLACAVFNCAAKCVGYAIISCAVLLKSFIVRLLLSSENFAYRKTRLPPSAVSILFVKNFLLFNVKTK